MRARAPGAAVHGGTSVGCATAPLTCAAAPRRPCPAGRGWASAAARWAAVVRRAGATVRTACHRRNHKLRACLHALRLHDAAPHAGALHCVAATHVAARRAAWCRRVRRGARGAHRWRGRCATLPASVPRQRAPRRSSARTLVRRAGSILDGCTRAPWRVRRAAHDSATRDATPAPRSARAVERSLDGSVDRHSVDRGSEWSRKQATGSLRAERAQVTWTCKCGALSLAPRQSLRRMDTHTHNEIVRAQVTWR